MSFVELSFFFWKIRQAVRNPDEFLKQNIIGRKIRIVRHENRRVSFFQTGKAFVVDYKFNGIELDIAAVYTVVKYYSYY